MLKQGLQGLGTELGIVNSLILLLIIIALVMYKWGPPWAKKKLKPKQNPDGDIALLRQAFEDCKEASGKWKEGLKEDLEKVEERLQKVERGMARIEGLLNRR